MSCKRVFPASPVAGFNSASIVVVSTGSISVSTNNPPIQKIRFRKNQKTLLHESIQKILTLHELLTFQKMFPTVFFHRILSFPSSWTFYGGYEARIRPAPGTGLYKGIGHLEKTSTFQVHPYSFITILSHQHIQNNKQQKQDFDQFSLMVLGYLDH